MIIYILACSIVLQLTAAVMAIRLIRLTGKHTAWSLIAAALVLMSSRRAIPLSRLLSGDTTITMDPLNELIGLVLSGLMVAGVAGIAPLFSAIRRSKEELLESMYFFKESQRAAFIGSYKTDFTSGFWESSEVLDRIFGIDRNYGRSVQGWLEIVHQDDREMMDRYLREEVISRRKPFNKEYRIVRKSDGEIRWVNGLGEVSFDAEGNVISLIGTIQDITERKRAEETLREERRLFVGGPTVVFKWRAAEGWPVDYVSQNVYAQFGYPAEALTNATPPFADLVHPDDLARVAQEVEKYTVAGTPLFEQEYRLRRADGEYRWLYDFTTVIRDAHGNVTHYLGYVQDITERKLAEDEIRKLNAELEQRVHERTAELRAANKELEAFSYSVSHDLRAPLRAMDGFSRITLEDYGALLPDEAKHHLDRIREGSLQMGRLIDDLLRFSRLSRQPLAKQTVDPAEIARQVWETLSAAEGDRRAKIRIGEMPLCQADPALLRQVLFNLLSNALKFTRGREVAQIEVGYAPDMQSPPGVSGGSAAQNVYYVKDNGVGFEMRYADKLFGVFQRLHRQEEYEGTGVGLAIVQRIIARHGGRIWAESTPNEGATFYLTLGESQVQATPIEKVKV